MRIQTRDGEVELTAEMVCRGMVFWSANYDMAPERRFTVGRRDERNEAWRDARDDGLGTNVLGAQRFLGCDPAIATRADCERFGVHGDAAAHGFARLRDGGAADLRVRANIDRGMIFQDAAHRVMVISNANTPPAGVFVGLDARHARPEDVVRLCCGVSNITSPDAAGVGPRCCTLAIGDHDTHEDLATGTRWPAQTVTTHEPADGGQVTHVREPEAAVRAEGPKDPERHVRGVAWVPRRGEVTFRQDGSVDYVPYGGTNLGSVAEAPVGRKEEA